MFVNVTVSRFFIPLVNTGTSVLKTKDPFSIFAVWNAFQSTSRLRKGQNRSNFSQTRKNDKQGKYI